MTDPFASVGKVMSPTEDSFRYVLGHFASGVVIVTGCVGEEPVGLTAQSFTAVSLSPPLVLFCPARTSTSWPKVRRAGRFCVNILGEDQQDVCRAFAVSGGDKFANVSWGWNCEGLPVIDHCLAYVECTLYDVQDAGDHHIAVGLVDSLRVGQAGRPLLFYRGSYGQLNLETESQKFLPVSAGLPEQ